MEARSGAQRMLAGGSAVVAALTTVIYVAVIQQEGNDPFWEVFPWVMVMLIGMSSAVASALTRDLRIGRLAAIAAAVVLGLLGMVAVFSVGIGFIVAAGLALLAAVLPSSKMSRA